MNTMMAFAMGEANRGKEMKVFDWDKAARIIAEEKPAIASAGLIEDWDYTGDNIYRDNEPYYDGYTYLASTWATPVLIVDYEEVECWIMESETEWNEHTKWPESALRILKGEQHE